jgi:SAM-dependent methyltransferase
MTQRPLPLFSTGTPPSSVEEVVAACVALGALVTGGPLSPEEERLARQAPAYGGDVEGLRHAMQQGSDPLGDAYCALRPSSRRRALGAFYTPPSVVEPMVAWALSRSPGRVVDAGCGSGRFAAAAVRQDPTLEVVAVDVDPAATLVARAVLGAIGSQRARVVNADYLRVSLARSSGLTAFVGNPPYVRHHDLGPETKAWAKRAAAEQGLPFSGLAGLHVYFLLATMKHARRGDVGCFVTSAEWLDVGYGKTLRAALLNGLGGESLHLVDARAKAFDDALATAVVACFEVGALDQGGSILPSGELQAASRWTPLFSPSRRQASPGMVRLGDVVRVSRGVATGNNAFFVLSLDRAEALRLRRWCVPALTRAREVLEAPGTVHLGSDRKLLLDPPRGTDPTAEGNRALREYLAEGRALKVHEGYLCTHRAPWWHVGAKAPPIVATYMARQAPAFALNPDGLAVLNVFHGLYPKLPLTRVQLEGLVAYLNENRAALRGAGRTYQGGLEKFEPREMEALLVPPPERLPEFARST